MGAGHRSPARSQSSVLIPTTQSSTLPHFRRPLVVISKFFICFSSLCANGFCCLEVSRPIMSRAVVCALISLFSISLDIFFRLSCFSSHLCFISPTEDGRYLKSQGGATDHLVPFPRSPALATRYNQGPAVPMDPYQYPGPPPTPYRFHTAYLPAISTAFLALLASRLLMLFSEALAPLPMTLPPFSRSHQLVSGTAETQHPPHLSLKSPPGISPGVTTPPVLSSTHPSSSNAVIISEYRHSSSSTFSTNRDVIPTAQDSSAKELRSQGKECLPDKRLDELSTTTPSASSVKYGTPACDPFPRPPTLVTRRKQDSTVPTSLRQCPSLSLALSRSRAARPPAFDAMFQAPRAQRLVLLFDNGTSAPLPATLLPSSRSRQRVPRIIEISLFIVTRRTLPEFWSPSPESPVVVTRGCWFPQSRDQSESAGSSGTRPPNCSNFDVLDVLGTLDVALLPAFAIVPAWWVSIPWVSLARSHKLPRSRQSPVSVLSLLVTHLFSHLMSSSPCLASSRSLVSQIVFGTIFFAFLVSLVSRLFLCATLLCSLVTRMYLSSVGSRFTFLDVPEIFFRLSCSSCFSFCLAFLTVGGRYLKSQGGAASHPISLQGLPVQQHVPCSHRTSPSVPPPGPTSHLAPSRLVPDGPDNQSPRLQQKVAQTIQDWFLLLPNPDSLNNSTAIRSVPSLAITSLVCREDFPMR